MRRVVGAGVTTGMEWAIPLAAIGNPTGTIAICALLADANSQPPGHISNQVLGPVPPGTCGLGPASGVDLAAIPGLQYFTIGPEPTGVPPSPKLGSGLRLLLAVGGRGRRPSFESC